MNVAENTFCADIQRMNTFLASLDQLPLRSDRTESSSGASTSTSSSPPPRPTPPPKPQRTSFGTSAPRPTPSPKPQRTGFETRAPRPAPPPPADPAARATHVGDLVQQASEILGLRSSAALDEAVVLPCGHVMAKHEVVLAKRTQSSAQRLFEKNKSENLRDTAANAYRCVCCRAAITRPPEALPSAEAASSLYAAWLRVAQQEKALVGNADLANLQREIAAAR